MDSPVATRKEPEHMIRTLRLAVAFGLLAALVVGTGTAAAQSAGRHKVLDKQLVGLPAAFTVVAGVTGAGHAWQLAEGNAKLFSDGRVLVNVEGLVLFPEGTQPAANVRIAVSCNGGATAADIVRSALSTQCRSRSPTATCTSTTG